MKFSIIIPVYNVAPYLRECLDSVFSAASHPQLSTRNPRPTIEIICIDDGSTDGSGAILDEYASTLYLEHASPYSHIALRIFHQQNKGVSAARNRGLEVATGEWIGFLDGDDLLSENTIRIWHDLVASNESSDVCVFETEQFPDGAAWRGGARDSYSSDVMDWSASISSRTMVFGFASRIYRREIIKGLTFPYYQVGEDLVFLIKAMIRARRIIVTDAVLYGYRQRLGSVSLSSISTNKVKDRILYTMEILSTLKFCPKRNTRIVAHSYLNALAECFWSEYLQLPRTDRHAVWQMWVDAVNQCRAFKRICTPLQYFRLCLVSCSRSYILAFLICYVPYWLKLHGLHR